MLIIPQNLVAPQTITLQFLSPSLGANLATVTAANLNVLRTDGTTSTWSLVIVSQTSQEMVCQYTFSGGELTVTGVYYLTGNFTLPGGVVQANAIACYVTAPNRGQARTEDSAYLVATSTVTGAMPSASAAVAAANAVCAVPNWYVDQLNITGLASDINNGTSVVTPLRTQAELTRRWVQAAATLGFGQWFPLRQDIVVTYLSASALSTDPINLNVERYSAFNLSFVYAPTIARTGGTIASIATVRGGANWWTLTASDGFTSADVGKLLVNTSKNTCAFVASVAAGVATTTEWLAYQTSALTQNGSGAFAITNPVVGDTYNVVNLARVKVGTLNIRQHGALTTAPSTAFIRFAVSFIGFSCIQDTQPFGTGQPDAICIQSQFAGIGLSASGVAFTQCAFDGAVNALTSFVGMFNCYVPKTQATNNGRHVQIGGLEGGITTSGSVVLLDGYCLILGRVGDQQAPAPSVILLGLVCLFGVQDAFTSEVKTQIRIGQQFYTTVPPLICGTCTRYLFRLVNGGILTSSGTIVWATTVVASFSKLVANESVPCNMLAYSQSTLTFGALYEVTLANLDDPAKLAGCAVDPGTGSSVRPFSSH